MNPAAVSVDPERLRAAARGAHDLADRLRRVRCAGLDGALPGSALERILTADAAAAGQGEIVAALLAWAQRARTAADGFAAADADSAARLRR